MGASHTFNRSALSTDTVNRFKLSDFNYIRPAFSQTHTVYQRIDQLIASTLSIHCYRGNVNRPQLQAKHVLPIIAGYMKLIS